MFSYEFKFVWYILVNGTLMLCWVFMCVCVRDYQDNKLYHLD